MFTHAYGTMLVPLFLLIQKDLHLKGVKDVGLIVTVYGVTYSSLSFKTGAMADRYNRRTLLAVGLLGNSLAILLMGFTHHYGLMLAWAVIGGMFGSLFHPTANALVPAHYPKSPGLAIGLLGIGSGLGFYLGPHFSGWRTSASWSLPMVSTWQKPLVELGIAGICCGVLFLFFATDPDAKIDKSKSNPEKRNTPIPLGRVLTLRTIWIALTLGCRDFSGVSSVSLIGIYLLKAHGYTAEKTGAILGSMMLISIFVNPLSVFVSPGKKRLPIMIILLVIGGSTLAFVPWIAIAWLLVVLAFFQTCHLGSYAVSDAAMLERVPGYLRGRVVGVFLTIAGTASACGPSIMGLLVDRLGERSASPSAYGPIFIFIGLLMVFSSTSARFIAALGPVQGARIEPFSETMPATMETMG